MTITRTVPTGLPGWRGFYASRRWLPACLFIFLVACSSLPSEFEQIPSQVWPHPEQTRLGELIAETAPADKSLSGIEIQTHDPGASIWRRMAARIMSWLPIEKEL